MNCYREYERPIRSRSASADGMTTGQGSVHHPAYSEHHRPFTYPNNLPSSYPRSFSSHDMTYEPSQTYEYPTVPITCSVPSSVPNPTMPLDQFQSEQAAIDQSAPPSAVPAYTPHGYTYTQMPVTFGSPPVIHTGVAAGLPAPSPANAWDSLATAILPEHSHSTSYTTPELNPTSHYDTPTPIEEPPRDSDDDSQGHSVSGASVAGTVGRGQLFPSSSSNPDTPLSALPYGYDQSDTSVPPQVEHRRSIERRAREKKRTAEREVHQLLLSQGIVLRGKANMLNALLELYKDKVREVKRLKDALEHAKPT